MPEVLRIRGYRFFFFSREGHEPRHIHVEQAERYAKFWLEPIELVEARGFGGSELRELHSINWRTSRQVYRCLGWALWPVNRLQMLSMLSAPTTNWLLRSSMVVAFPRR
jgi:Domain of unknown function (DUF4160)